MMHTLQQACAYLCVSDCVLRVRSISIEVLLCKLAVKLFEICIMMKVLLPKWAFKYVTKSSIYHSQEDKSTH